MTPSWPGLPQLGHPPGERRQRVLILTHDGIIPAAFWARGNGARLKRMARPRMSDWEHFTRLLYEYVETDLDQFDHWRLEPAGWSSPVYVDVAATMP
jgi:hypothetical protein